MRALPPALLALALLAGCVGQAEFAPGEHRLSGVFLGAAFPTEIQELEFYTKDAGGQFATDGGLPASFFASGLTGAGCKALHGFALTRVYLATVSDCEPVDPAPSDTSGAARSSGSVLVSAPVG